MDLLRDVRRLATLRATGLLDADSDKVLDRLTRVAGHVLGVPVSLVTLIDASRQFFASSGGAVGEQLPVREGPLDVSFCKFVVVDDAPFVVNDKSLEPRVADLPVATQAYAGFPLRAPNGDVMGSFCVFDLQPRTWTPDELAIIEDLAAAAAAEIALRLSNSELKASELRMTNMLEAAHDAFIAMDDAGRVQRWNAAAERLFGWSAEEVLDRPLVDLIIPEELRAAHLEGLERVRGGGESRLAGHRIELPALRRDGTTFPIELSVMSQVEPELSFQAFLHDISARKRAREALEDERLFLQSLLDSLDTPVLACAADATITVVNQAAINAGDPAAPFDLAAELVGTVYGADGHTTLSDAAKPLARAFRGEVVDGQEIVVRAPGDLGRRYVVNGRRLEGSDGRGLGAVIALHDITSQRRGELLQSAAHAVATALAHAQSAEEAGVESAAALARVLGWVAAEYWRVSADGQAVVRVGAWQAPGRDLAPFIDSRNTRLARGESVTGRVFDLAKSIWMADIDDFADTFRRYDLARVVGLRSGLVLPILRGRRIIGALAFFHDALVADAPDLVTMLESVCVQVGEFVELAEERERVVETQREQVVRLREIDKVKDELIAVVSHELRNPITTIRGFAELLADEPLDNQQQAFVAGIERNSAQLLTIVTDLLTMAALNRGSMRITRQRFALDELLAEALAEHAHQAELKRLAVTTRLDTPVTVEGDVGRIRQVVDNLLSNATKYTPEGGDVVVRVEVDVDVAVITVGDTGIGIPAEQYEQMFTPFFRTSTALESGISGTGLGLAITKGILEEHDGSIEVGPNTPHGTVFTVRLPLSRRD